MSVQGGSVLERPVEVDEVWDFVLEEPTEPGRTHRVTRIEPASTASAATGAAFWRGLKRSLSEEPGASPHRRRSGGARAES